MANYVEEEHCENLFAPDDVEDEQESDTMVASCLTKKVIFDFFFIYFINFAKASIAPFTKVQGLTCIVGLTAFVFALFLVVCTRF